MSALDRAREQLRAHLETGDGVAALEAFEAAVRANERATPPLTPCTCRQAVHAREHTAFVHGCPWCHAPRSRPGPPVTAVIAFVALAFTTTSLLCGHALYPPWRRR